MSVVWHADFVVDGQVTFRVGRDGDRCVAEWVGLATLTAKRDGSCVTAAFSQNTDAAVVAKLRGGTMRALLRHLRGDLSLHASAVSRKGNAMAIVGDSGAGKSTLAFALANSESRDFALLSDDCLSIDGQAALPSEVVGWLDTQARIAFDLSASVGKSATSPRRVAREPAHLIAIVHLAYGHNVRIRRLRGYEAATVLSRALVRFVLDEPSVHRADMDRLTDLAASVEVLELRRPRGMEHLDRTLIAIDQFTTAWHRR